ncbi:MAG: hypothetical protein ACREMZ_17345 [Gemmatimonadales bacterium]
MSDSGWRPLSRRTVGQAAEGPFDGVPAHLYQPLQEWLYHVLQRKDGPVMFVRPGYFTTDTRRVMLRIQSSEQPWLLRADDPLFLDAIDASLRWRPWVEGWDDENPATLEEILESGNSIWRVSGEFLGLERRIDTTVTAAVSETVSSASDEAADHLRRAWESAYGRNPDPDTCYRESVLAVESAACPLVLPTASRPTVGLVRDHLRDAGGKWELVLPDQDDKPAQVDVVVSMLSALEQGHRSRHAGSARNARRQSQAEAEAAVHLASTLVHWLSTGVVRRKA